MKSNLKLFNEDSFELEMMIKNKLNLYKSPVDILNEKEIQELKNNFSEYSKKVEKLIHSFNDLNEEKSKNKHRVEEANASEYYKLYENVIKKYKDMQSQIEAYIVEFEEKEYRKENERMQRRSNASIGSRDDSDLSEYEDTDKLEITRIFLNSVMTTHQATELQRMTTLEEEQLLLMKFFNLRDSYPNSPSKQEILIDFYTNNYKFCLKHKFTIEKISTFMSIIYFIFTFSVMNKKIIKEKSMSIFRDIIDYHSLNRPPYCYEVFDRKEKTIIISFVNSTFYRNYTLFENIFKYNLNIFLHSDDFKPIPAQRIPLVSANHQLNKNLLIENPKSLEILEKLYFNNDKKAEEKVNNNISKKLVQESKTENELREEAAAEKLKTFVNSFYKSKDTYENEKLMQEQLMQGKLTEFEVKETKAYLDVKIPELVKETSDKIQLTSKETLKAANARIASALENKNKK